MGGCYHVRLLLIAVERYFKVIPCLILSFRTPEGPPEYRLRNGREIGPIALHGNKGACLMLYLDPEWPKLDLLGLGLSRVSLCRWSSQNWMRCGPASWVQAECCGGRAEYSVSSQPSVLFLPCS